MPWSAENLTQPTLDIQEGISITDAPAILATLYPALLRLARQELLKRGDNPADAEDLVQAVTTLWFEAVTTETGAYGYMRRAIRTRVRNRQFDGRDAMNRHPLSLEEIT